MHTPLSIYMNQRIRLIAVLLGTLLFMAACGGSPDNKPMKSEVHGINLKLIPAFNGAIFKQPIGLFHAGDGSGRLFIVEKPGIIRLLSNSSDNAEQSVFLDIRDQVNDSGTEQGLLGLAFHPDYEHNGFFYVNYTTENSTVIARYMADSHNPDKAVRNSGQILLEFHQPFPNHNGGELAFDPSGYLLIATGDGGSGGDPQGNGQNLKALLGKLLRIDVNGASADKPYAIPADNPFIGNNRGYREEIYAYGLRNPWRFSFDRETGRLWAADVGQNKAEEINIIEKGKNYGWNIMEGSGCYLAKTCDKTDLVFPIWEYHPLKGGGASVTGGYVYRGQEIPALYGHYVFADFIDGRIWALHYDGAAVAEAELLPLKMPNITSFGEDEQGELFACLFDGRIMRWVAQ